MKMNRKLVTLLFCMVTVLCTTVTAHAWERRKDDKKQLVVGVSWKTFQEERYVRELNVMKDICESQGIEFIYQVSENDAMKQVNQIENLVSQGIDILIVLTNEKQTMTNALRAASESGVLVCFYEAVQGETYADLSGGNVEFSIGQQITQTVAETGLTGKVAYMCGDPAGGASPVNFLEGMKDGMKGNDVEVIGEQWAANWDPSVAMANTENWITQYGDELKAVLCMNDGLAGGAIEALERAGLAGNVLVCGQDCDLVAVQRILEGTQISTILKSGNEYPELFLDTCLDYYVGNLSDADFEVSDENCDGTAIPFMKYDGIIITKDNVDTVIDMGVYTHEEVYGE